MRLRRVLALSLFLLGLSACGGDEIKPDLPPIVGVLELPIAHRTGDKEPAGAARIELGTTELREGGQTLFPLENGKVPAAEQQGHSLPKLKAKLAGKSALAITMHAGVPYATLARVLNTALEAGAKTFAFKVRKQGSNTETGWLVVDDNHFVASAEDGKFPPAALLPWDAFTAVWEDAITACQGTERVDCGYRPLAKATGGQLDMMLRVRGSGAAIRMRQIGVPPPPEPAPVEEKKPSKKGEPKEGEEPPPEPSTEHVFTLRAEHATQEPSPISGIVKGVCSGQSCAAVVDAEGISMGGRVISLLGAAFPNGTPAPKLAWVLPP